MKNILFSSMFVMVSLAVYANDCPRCCEGYGGILYADSSSGRFVCQNGSISQCYSTRHAVMDLQKFKGCCMWNGGVKKVTPKGQVVCRDGVISEICSLRPKEKVAVF
jgi:hypothetical protein